MYLICNLEITSTGTHSATFQDQFNPIYLFIYYSLFICFLQ